MLNYVAVPALALIMSGGQGLQAAQEGSYLSRMKALGLPSLNGKTLAYYSHGYRQHAERLQLAIAD